MNCRNTTTATLRRTWGWLKAGLLGAALALVGMQAQAQVSVTATAGTAGPTAYTTVSAAFAAINAGTHQGAITISITGNTSEPGSPTALLRSASPSNYTSVLIRPSGGNFTIGGTITANRAIIELNGADNVTINGDDPGTAGVRNLTIGFSTTAATIAACVRVSSNSTLGSDGANNNVITNCIITGNRALLGTTATYGINMSNYSTTSLATGGYSSINNRFENNLITRCYVGIWAVGASATYPNTGLQIIGNVLGDNTAAGNIGNRAIIVSNSATTEAQSAIIRNNEVVGAGDPGTTGYAASIAGIEIGTASFGTKLYNNYVHDVKQPSTSGYGAYGVLFSGATSCDSLRFYNNIVTRITASNYTTTALSSFTNYGVKMTAGPTFAEFSNNTIVLSTANPTGITTNPISYALSCDVNGVRMAKFRNNIIMNSVASTNAIGIYVNSNAIYSAANYTTSGAQVWDRNCYWVPSGVLGFSAASTPQATFSAWKSATTKDAASYNVLPNFVSASDLHINGSTASLLESGGLATPYTTDFDGQVRPGPAGSTNGGAAFFDVGADEFDGIRIIPVSISSASATASSCTAIAHTVTATVVQGSNPITSVTLSYLLNGVSQTPIAMTNTSGSIWQGIIPAATPTNAVVAWTVTAVDPAASPTSSGSYQDDALNGVGITATATPTAVCTGSNTSLAAIPYNPGAAPTSYTIQQVTNPTTDEDLGNVTITDAATSTVLLNNTTTYNSLSGTLGTGTGTAGSFASYITLATVPMTAGATYSFSLSSLQGVTAYSNSMAIYIDLNRDGDYADAGEGVYVAAATTLGAHTESGSFTLPATANNGLTRMRVMVNEGTITSPTMTLAYGEREEYLVNITSPNNGGGGNIPAFTYSWSNGTNVVGTGTPLSTPVSTPTTFTVTGTTTAGCTINGSVATTTIALPGAPTATNSTQCGAAVPTASMASNTGLPTPTYRWYASATGGSTLQSGTSATYGTSINTTTTFYVAEFDGTCESTRTPVTVTVNTPPTITASASTAICSGQSTTLSASSSNAGYDYTWSGGAGTGASVTVAPSATTTYTVTALDNTVGQPNSGCTTSATTTVTVNQSPSAVTVTRSAAAVCPGGSSTLTVTGGTNSGAFIQGALNTVNGTTGYPAPFSNYYGGAKHQMLFTVAELTALGYQANDRITSLGFAVSAVGSTFSGTLNNFTIAIKHTSASALTTTFETGLTQVASLNWAVPTTGLPLYTFVTFPTPFIWNGTSNLIIQTSYSNANSGTSTDWVQTYLTNVGTTVCSWYRVDAATAAAVLGATTATSTGTNRPDVRLGWERPATLAWSPVSSSANSITVTPSGTTTYSVTATNLAGCTASGSATVTVNPFPTATLNANGPFCGSGSPALTGVLTGTGPWSITYTTNGGSPVTVSGIASSPFTINPAGPISSSTTYAITAVSDANCAATSLPASVQVVVNTPVNWYADTDGDGFGAGASTGLACAAPNPGDVTNNTDGCPTDPNKVVAGICGCGTADTDSDGDGTANCNDGCPNDPNKIAPGICGCGVSDADSDGDGTANCNDGCPNDPNKTAAGICGCGTADTDSDGDGTANCNDGCPNDPNKIAAGQCGCGTADTDSDNDGTANCNDGCPNDPLKTSPGICGCGTADTDSDGDGTANCNDGCPNDPNKIAPGICGCGTADTDSDGDGVANCIDNCPNVAGQIGSNCNDNNVCTINDVLNASCVCVGTVQDTDGDGVCDANDNCPTVTGQVGSSCNDNNACTINDVLNASCVCVGTQLTPTVSIAAGGPTTFCQGGSVVLTATAGSTCAPVSYAWLLNGTTPVGTDNSTYTANASGSYTCVVTIGNSNTATSNAISVTVNPIPSVGASGSSPVYCTPGNAVVLTATGATTYSWAPAAGLNATTGSSVNATPATATTYTVTGTSLGCSSTATVTVTKGTKPAAPVMSATPNSNICPGGSSQLAAVIGAAPSYCATSRTTGCSAGDEFISNVTFGTINKNSTCAQSGTGQYTDYTGISTTVTAGATGLAISVGNPNFFSGDQCAVYIDWNQNGNLEEAGEVFTLTGTTTFSGTVSVPAGALNGATRMRVGLFYSGAIGACGNYSYGEAEDYTVNITGGTSACAAGINFSWSPTTYLNNPLICNPQATGIMATTTYTVTASNASGCSRTNTVTVAVQTTDTDGDGTVNCLDGCPIDPNKTAPGICGCGVADTDSDGDGTANCFDGCPNDPNKIAPGICGCGVADTDSDSDGTANCFDLCPNDPGKIVPGICGCGTPDTDTDGDGLANCLDNCPLVSGVIGSACSDNNPATLNDVLDANCVCTGSTLTCPDQSVVVDLRTDNSGSQTSWDIVNVGTTTVQCSGSGYLNNQTLSIGCCLASGCYELRVFDSAGDGMANGTVGGYVLRMPNGTRIIDNSNDGIFTFTSQIASNLGFCIPLGTNTVIPAHCDKTNWLPNDVIQATVNPAVTAQFGVTNSTSGYQFWFFNPDGGYTRRVLQTHAAPGSVTGAPTNVRAAYLSLSSLTTSPLPLYTNLNVRIRVQIAGVFSEWGPTCRFRLDPPCSTTTLTTSANPVVSCGATGLTFNSLIYANEVAGANRYQFEFTRTGYLRRIASTTRSQALNWVTNPLQNNTCYNVRVRVSFDGGSTYCPFGPTCTVTVGTALCTFAMPTEPTGITAATETGRLTVFPNPNNGDQVSLVLSAFDRSVNTIQVDVNDIYGKFITRRNIAVQDGYMNTVLSFEKELVPGMYLLNLQAGDQRFTERMIVQ